MPSDTDKYENSFFINFQTFYKKLILKRITETTKACKSTSLGIKSSDKWYDGVEVAYMIIYLAGPLKLISYEYNQAKSISWLVNI